MAPTARDDNLHVSGQMGLVDVLGTQLGAEPFGLGAHPGH